MSVVLNLPKLSKKQYAQQWLTTFAFEKWSRCIHCHEPLALKDSTLICVNHHQFDSARQGYYFLSKVSLASTKYDKQLFLARRNLIIQTPFYQQLHQVLVELIEKHQPTAKVIVDAGSGEDSHLFTIGQRLLDKVALVGVDLAKDGVMLSTDYNEQMLSLVSDLANLPFSNQSVDVILNILSPSNYQEFKRVLKSTGMMIKVIPNRDYLAEVRTELAHFGIAQQENFDNHNVSQVFMKHFTKSEQLRVVDKVELTLAQKQSLVQMTPLCWRLDVEKQKALAERLPHQITLDVTVLVGWQS